VGWLGSGIGQDLDPAWRRVYGQPLPSGISWTVLTEGRASISKVVAIVTPAGAEGPGLVIKWPRTVTAAASLAREAAMLSGLQNRALPDGLPLLVETRPHPLGTAIVETMLPGVPMGRLLTPARHLLLGIRVVDWLVNLPAPGPSEVSGAAALADGLIDRLEQRIGSTIAAFEISRLRALVPALDGLPLVVEHRDLAPWNILVDDGRIGVVDWESSVASGLPVLDLWYFLTYAGLAVEGHGEACLAEVYPGLQDRQTRAGKVSANLLERYTACLGLDPDLVPTLRALTWVAHMPSELDRRPKGADPTSATFMRLLTHELAH
jgi:hypothetical protein